MVDRICTNLLNTIPAKVKHVVALRLLTYGERHTVLEAILRYPGFEKDAAEDLLVILKHRPFYSRKAPPAFGLGHALPGRPALLPTLRPTLLGRGETKKQRLNPAVAPALPVRDRRLR